MHLTAVPIQLDALGLPRTGEPVTRGIPFPQGLVTKLEHLGCLTPDGETIPLQVRGLERWGDGSWKWILCDWVVSVVDHATYHITVHSEPNPLTDCCDLASSRVNQTGYQQPKYDLELVDEHGALLTYAVRPETIVEEQGNIRYATKQIGYFLRDGQEFAKVTVRSSAYQTCPVVRLQITLQNFRRAIHPGGLWDLGDAGSILFKRFSVRLKLVGLQEILGQFSLEQNSPELPLQLPFELYQDSSGGENWKSTNHISRTREIPLQFCGYQATNGNEKFSGKRATPKVILNKGEQTLGIAVPQFWQNFPKAISASEDGLHLQLFPEQTLEPHELQGGEQKTHVFYLLTGTDTITQSPLEWCRQPLIPVIDPGWVEQSKAISYVTAAGTEEERYQELVDSAITGKDSFANKREIIDEYGWRHFGDIYGDHEAILHTEYGPNPRISHYNGQYDPTAGFAYQWLRRGDSRWYQMMSEHAFHIRDIDLYNTDEDKAAYNHGLFWHTYHYVDADTGTHRSYPKNGRVPPHQKLVPGGGPGNEQNYAHGLLLHYYLTGDAASRESCLGMAQWVIDMDDGTKTIFKYLSQADTGVASASRSPDYHGPGRGSGNSVATLLDGFRLSQDRKFLNKAEQLIKRVIHPEDNIQRIVGMTLNGKNYVDAENRWFYLMMLQSLGKYLDVKASINECDEMYAYARACLLHYARWMITNEYPYLSRPEILEYPTETWVAQDMRKCEVFQFAALHAEGDERHVFEKKAIEFHDYVLNTLPTMPTKTLCRPVVLLLSYGWSRFWHRKYADDRRPKPTVNRTTFPAKVHFVPQKVIAKKRAKMIVGIGGILGMVLIAIAVRFVFFS